MTIEISDDQDQAPETPRLFGVPDEPTPKFKLGWKGVHEEDKKVLSARSHLFGAPLLPRNMPKQAQDLMPYARVLGERDQGNSSECVGYGITNAAFIRLCVLGFNPALLSPHAVYTLARMMSRVDKKEPIYDDGTYPYFGIKAMSKFGIPPEAVCPSPDSKHFDYGAINDELSIDTISKASSFKVTRYARIDSDGEDRILDVKNALLQKFPVPFGTTVSRQWQNYTGGIFNPVSENPVGGHEMCIVGFTEDEEHGTVFDILNSWGDEWGEGGLGRVTSKFLTENGADSFYAFHVG